MDSPLERKLPFFIEKGEAEVSSSFLDLLLPRGSWKMLDVSMQWDIKLVFSLLLMSRCYRAAFWQCGLGTESLKTELSLVGGVEHGQAGLRHQLRTLQVKTPNLVIQAPCLAQRGRILQGSA